MTTVLPLLLAALFVPAAPASACSRNPREPLGLTADAARVKRVADRIRSAQEVREKARAEAWARLKADAIYQEFDKKRSELAWNSPERADVNRLMRLIEDREVWAKVTAADPLDVVHTAYLCGNVTLEDGHSINAGSSWSVSHEARPDLGRVDIDGPEGHYLLEHGQATPFLLEALERLIDATPAAAAPPAPKPLTLLEPARLEVFAAPRWDR
jgi:hypothetical protein